MQKEEASSPTASLESILLTAAIEAAEKHDIASIDVPNALFMHWWIIRKVMIGLH